MMEAMWIANDQPIPEGWKLASNEGRIRDHHSHYARMIVREVDDESSPLFEQGSNMSKAI